ncbi:MAG: hypothetical protein HON32_06710 [Francisellaceae bacterium]|jgi:hypothetical protein|nr:hypothetical protein [Francisellaceae bacterium]MBT6539302.1 hypothetical protein [Francisellaceae bacterium]
MWRYLYFIFAVPNPIVFLLFYFLSDSRMFIFNKYAGVFLESGDYYVSLGLYILFAFLVYGAWYSLQYGLVRIRNVISVNDYFRTKFWIMALMPFPWGAYFIYQLTRGIPENEFSLYLVAGSFWGSYSIIVFLYQFRVAVFRGEFTT